MGGYQNSHVKFRGGANRKREGHDRRGGHGGVLLAARRAHHPRRGARSVAFQNGSKHASTPDPPTEIPESQGPKHGGVREREREGGKEREKRPREPAGEPSHLIWARHKYAPPT